MRRLTLAALLFVAAPAAAQDCTADVEVREQDGLKLEIAYKCRSAAALTFNADGDKMARRVSDFASGAGDHPTPSNNAWSVEPRDGWVIARYRFDLTGYARAIDSNTSALQRGEGALVLLGGWLLEPRGLGQSPVIDIRVKTAPGLSFAAGLPKVDDAWRLNGTNLRFAGYTAIGKLDLREIAVPLPGSLRPGGTKGNGVVRLAMLEGFSDSDRAVIAEWVTRTAAIESNYWDGFTVPQMLLGLVPTPGKNGVGYGRTVPGGGATVMVEIGTKVEERKLYNDWVLVHELIHTGMPYVRGRATWFMEGAATYVEPIIRARAGWKTEAEVWDEWIGQMPQGSMALNMGLANAQGRGNYWGGATFMLLADLAIRKGTDGAKGLEDCLKGALWGGLDGSTRTNLEDYAAACDRATGTWKMADLVGQHLTKGKPVDLAKLWAELGVAKGGVFNDDAPSAKWRKMIVYGNKPVKTVKRPWED